MPNPLGIPDEALTKRPSSLRELLAGTKIPHVVQPLQGAAWGALAGQRVGLRSLPSGVLVEATGAAIAWCRDVAKIDERHLYNETGEEALDLEIKVQILAKGLVQPDAPDKPFTEGPADVRELLTPEQVTWLFDRWSAWQRERSPYEVLADEAKIEEVAEALGKGFASPTSLTSYDFGTLRRISLSLVARLRKLTTESSSASKSGTES